jgi:uncharacterized protein (DUF1697 family)
MPRYVAFLRAVNVGGRVVKMEALRRIFEGAGLASVETFIASGNVVFDAPAADAGTLERKIERALDEALGYRVATFVRTLPELAAAAARVADEESHVHVGFLKAAPAAAVKAKLMAFNDGINEFSVHGRELYWRLDGRFSDSTITGATVEKTLQAETTLRNGKTVRRLAAKCYDPRP